MPIIPILANLLGCNSHPAAIENGDRAILGQQLSAFRYQEKRSLELSALVHTFTTSDCQHD